MLSPVDTASFLGANPLTANPVTRPAFVPFTGRNPLGCPRSPEAVGHGLNRIGPTCKAYAWVYRAPLLRALLAAFDDDGSPPLNPLDIWVWEILSECGMLGHALAPDEVQVLSSLHGSVKEGQDARKDRNRLGQEFRSLTKVATSG